VKPIFWLTLLFVLASGLSAYIGNEWGRKLGKRKLSVFTLRPRHTSTFLTILLSMTLSLGLFGTLLLLAPNARQALFQDSPGPVLTDSLPVQVAQVPELAAGQNSELNTALNPLQAKPPQTLAPAPAVTQAEPLAAPLVTPQARPQMATAPVPQPALRSSQAAPANAPQLQAMTRAQAQPEQAMTPAAVQQPVGRPAPATSARPERPERMAQIKPATGSLKPADAQEPAVQIAQLPEPGRVMQPVFALQVYGGLSAHESQNLLAGVLDLTRDYARLTGSLPQAPELIQVRAAEWTAGQRQLQAQGLFQIEVELATPQHTTPTRPVKLLVKASPETPTLAADFDPHELLESARLDLGDPTQNQPLRQELRLAMQELAQDTRTLWQPPSGPVLPMADASWQSARLPFDVLNLKRSGQMLQGLIVLRATQTNLTQN